MSLSALGPLPSLSGRSSLGLGGLAPLPSLSKPSFGSSSSIGSSIGTNSNNSKTITNGISTNKTASSSSSSSSSSTTSRIKPMRLAIRYEPPTLAMDYIDNKYVGTNRHRIKCMLIDITSGNTQKIVNTLIQTYTSYLSHVAPKQLERLIDRLLSHRISSSTSSSFSSSHQSHPITSTSTSYDDDEYPEEEPEIEIEARDDDDDDDDKEDLNRVDDDVLNRKKQDMSKDFTAHLLKPGDPGYVYDKQVEFEETEPSDWD